MVLELQDWLVGVTSMRWTKLGKIFNPIEHKMPAGCFEYAQSPQVLILPDCIRIYFSTRAIDPDNKKFLSYVSFVDYSKDFAKILRVAENPVVSLGHRGCFDEHGIFPFSPISVGGALLSYTTGWSRRVSVSVETGIGIVESTDHGLTFHRRGDGPILSASLHEPCLVGDGFVRQFNGIFHMWYIFGLSWKQGVPGQMPDRIYKIGHATSDDGMIWKKEEGRQIISDVIDADECQALPTVIELAGKYHMYFCYRASVDFRTNPANSYRLGYATSTDLSSWIREDNEAGITRSETGWDSQMMCYPHLFASEGKTYLLYNGDQFGRFGFGLAVLSV